MTSTEIERHGGGALELRSNQTDWTPKQRAALSQLGLQQASNADLAVFMHQAQRTGLDPFSRQIYMIARWDSQSRSEKFTIQTGIDGFRVIADRHPQYGGQVGPEWCGEDGIWRDVWTSREAPVAARVGVIRKDWSAPIYAVALFREYCGTTKDKQTGGQVLTRMWREKGALMIAKCAEALALRKAFPHDLSGIYTAEEMTQADQAAVPQQRPSGDDWASRPATAEERGQQAETFRHGDPASPLSPLTDDEWTEVIANAVRDRDVDELRKLWHDAKKQRPGDLALRERIAEASRDVAAPKEQPAADEPVDAEIVVDRLVKDDGAEGRARRRMHALFTKSAVTRDEKLTIVELFIGEPVASTNDLTAEQVDIVVGRLAAAEHKKGGLKAAAEVWLQDYAQAAEQDVDVPAEATS